MRILHLSKFYPPDPGGLEQAVAGIAEGAAAAGHEVRVVCATGTGWDRRRAGLSPDQRNGVAVDRLATHGILWSQPITPGYFRAARWAADVIHLHHPHPLADLAFLLGPRSRTPLVITQHSDVRRQAIVKPFYWPLVRTVLREARAIVVASDAHIGVSTEIHGFEPKVTIIPYGVDDRRFGADAGVARPAGFPSGDAGAVGLFVGRLVGYKGLDVLIQAVAGTDLRVVVVGDGPLKDWLDNEVADRGLAANLTVVGEVSEADLPAYHRAADYFVLPSTSPAEMFGIVLIEAMACSTPVITTALPTGVREVNQRDVTGLEVPPGDVEALRAAMQRMVVDADLRKRLGAAGRRRVEERFTLGVTVAAHLALYEQIAGSR